MSDQHEIQTALGDVAARQLANATKPVPQMTGITPRWLAHLLQWVPVETGIYRLNRVKHGSHVAVDVRAALNRRHRRPIGAPLRAADLARFRGGEHGAPVACVLQHLRRD